MSRPLGFRNGEPWIIDKETQPPARISQGKLIELMEERGLGTKATRADIIQKLYDRATAAGYTVGQEGQIGGEQGRFAYFDTQHDQGTVIEISDISGAKGQMFAHIRQEAATWDGTEPIRRIG